MRFGVREVCNVVLKARQAQRLGKKIFYKNEPVMYFDTLKTSSMEGQSSTVYAQGGRGNPRLVAWEGERTVTFTMEDALISPEGLSILTGAGLIDAKDKTIYQHVTEVIDVSDLDFGQKDIYTRFDENTWKNLAGESVYTFKVPDGSQEGAEKEWVKKSGAQELSAKQLNSFVGTRILVDSNNNSKYDTFKNGTLSIPLSNEPYLPRNGGEDFAYVMFMKNGEVITEPYIPVHGDYDATTNSFGVKKLSTATESIKKEFWCVKGFKSCITVSDHPNYNLANSYADLGSTDVHHYDAGIKPDPSQGGTGNNADTYDVREFPFIIHNDNVVLNFDSVFVDYYVERTKGATQIEITADKFGGNYYLEAETLFRTQDGLDLPAEFVIPNCKVQSNFTFSMNNSGDPSTFTFTMDAFPDYTRFDHTHKVFAAIQIIEDIEKEDLHRHSTGHEPVHDDLDWY